MRHISDSLIQQYVDKTELTDRSTVENHLLACFECQENLEQYQELYRHLAVECEVVPDESLNINVLAAVARIESKQKSRRHIQIAGTISGFLLLALSLNYFGLFNWERLLSAAKATTANLVNPFYETVGLLAAKLDGNLALLAFAGLILLLFHLLDYSLLKVKVNRT